MLQFSGDVTIHKAPGVEGSAWWAGAKEDDSARPPLLAFPLALALAAAAILFVYSPQGPRVVIGVTAYLISLSTIKITVKLLFSEFSFKFPSFLTALHMGVSAAVGFAVLLRRKKSTGKHIIMPTRSEFFGRILPITTSFGLSLMANNYSLLSCSTSFNEIVSSTSPICTVVVVVLMGMPFDLRLLGPTFVVVAGCAIAATGEAKFSAMGFALVMFGNACRALKGAMQQELMTGRTRERFDPCALLAWTCVTSFAMLAVWSAASEGLEPYVALAQQRQRPFFFLLALALSCANAAVLNVAALFVTQDLGAVGVTIVAQTRAVLTILGGVIVFHDVVSPQEAFGFTVVMAGAYMYARTEQQAKEQRAKDGAASFVGFATAAATFDDLLPELHAKQTPTKTPLAPAAASVVESLPPSENCRL